MPNHCCWFCYCASVCVSVQICYFILHRRSIQLFIPASKYLYWIWRYWILAHSVCIFIDFFREDEARECSIERAFPECTIYRDDALCASVCARQQINRFGTMYRHWCYLSMHASCMPALFIFKPVRFAIISKCSLARVRGKERPPNQIASKHWYWLRVLT